MAYFDVLDAPPAHDVVASLRAMAELRMLFHAMQAPPTPRTTRLLFAYLLIVDKAVREYEAGRLTLLEHLHDNGGIPAFVIGMGRFETCINAMKRALRLLTMLGTKSDAPTYSRNLRKVAQSRGSEITDVRDAIEHIEQDIMSADGLAEGEAHLLTINKAGTKLEVGKHEISFHAVHCTLSALHKAGREMIDALPSQPQPDCAAPGKPT